MKFISSLLSLLLLQVVAVVAYNRFDSIFEQIKELSKDITDVLTKEAADYPFAARSAAVEAQNAMNAVSKAAHRAADDIANALLTYGQTSSHNTTAVSADISKSGADPLHSILSAAIYHDNAMAREQKTVAQDVQDERNRFSKYLLNAISFAEEHQ